MKSEKVDITKSDPSDALDKSGTNNQHILFHSIDFLRPKYFISHFLIIILFLFSCTESFQPLSDSSTLPLSIYGYLDASADTQWVRVTPIREQLDMADVKPEMEVYLEHLQSGNSVKMSDSLMTLQGEYNVLNAWTTMEIEPGQSYRLESKRPDGATSRVSVTMPGEITSYNLMESDDGCLARLRVEGVENLADFQTRWHILALYNTGGMITDIVERHISIPYKRNAVQLASGSYSVSLNTDDELHQIMSGFISPPSLIKVIRRVIFVASAGPDWVEELSSLNDLVYALPEGLSNVENGLGYMVGIVSLTIPWERCFR